MRGDRAALALVQALLFGTGPAATFPLEVGAFLRSDKALDIPDLQSHFLPGLSTAALRLPFFRGAPTRHNGHGFFANVYRLRPESRGTISIRSADPFAAPVIKPNYLSTESDRRALREGIRRLREVFAQRALDPYRGSELAPGPDVTSDAQLDAWLAATADTAFHPWARRGWASILARSSTGRCACAALRGCALPTPQSSRACRARTPTRRR